jgi:hypothetical protein
MPKASKCGRNSLQQSIAGLDGLRAQYMEYFTHFGVAIAVGIRHASWVTCSQPA